MLLAMLAIAESRRVQQYGRFATDLDLNWNPLARKTGRAGASSSARNLELKSTSAEPRSQELARMIAQQTDILLMEILTRVADPRLQEEIRSLTGEVKAMMADSALQEKGTLIVEQLEKVRVDANLQEQAKQFLEQAEEVGTQIEMMITDPGLTLAERSEAMDAIMANPTLQEQSKRMWQQLEAMIANQNFQDQFTPVAQLMETLMADIDFQRHARRVAAHVDAIRAHLTSQKTDSGPTLDLSSLAEVNRSSSGVSFVPPSLPAGKPATATSQPAASQGPRSHIHMSEPQPAVMPRRRHLMAPWRRPRATLAPPRANSAVMSAAEKSKGIDISPLLCLALLFHSEAAHALAGVAPGMMVESDSAASVLATIGTALADADDFGGYTIPIVGLGVLAATIAILAGPVED